MMPQCINRARSGAENRNLAAAASPPTPDVIGGSMVGCSETHIALALIVLVLKKQATVPLPMWSVPGAYSRLQVGALAWDCYCFG